MFEYSLVKTFILINSTEVLHFSPFFMCREKGVADPAVPWAQLSSTEFYCRRQWKQKNNENYQ